MKDIFQNIIIMHMYPELPKHVKVQIMYFKYNILFIYVYV